MCAGLLLDSGALLFDLASVTGAHVSACSNARRFRVTAAHCSVSVSPPAA